MTAFIASVSAQPTFAPPQIAHPSEMDLNRNRIDDLLDRQLQVATTQTLQEVRRVELIFKQHPTQVQADAFRRLGGAFDYQYRAVSYGWNGRIPLGAIPRVESAMGPDLVFISAEHACALHLDEATRGGRVRPIWATGFVGGAGLSGSSTTTIAILDSGLDGTHTDLAGRQVWWKDYSSSGAGSPVDYGGHGSHVAGIALGTGTAMGVSPTFLPFTDSYSLSGVPNGSGYVTPIHIPTASCAFNIHAEWLGGGTGTLHWTTQYDNATTLYTMGNTSGSSPINWSASFSPTSGMRYGPFLVSNGSMTSTSIYGTLTYAGLGDGFSPLRGVAPGAKWAGCKVFTNAGSGSNLQVEAAIDEMVANRVALNVKVMNMSLGFPSGFVPTVRAKVNSAVANGIVVVVSAGNNGPSTAMTDPASAAKAITVAAGNDQNQLTSYTSVGVASPDTTQDMKPDLIAPGGSASRYTAILSVDSNSSDAGSTTFADRQANDYTGMEGTSMASPFVAGCAALVIQALEDAGVVWDFNSDQSSLLVKMLLCATSTESNQGREGGTNSPALGRSAAPKDTNEGYGMINPDAAIEAARLSYTWGTSLNGSTAGGRFDQRAWGRTVALTTGGRYQLNLTNPSTGDFDLYLYRSTPDAKGNPVFLAASSNAENGTSESIDYTATSDGNAYLVVKRVSGSGSWTLNSTETLPVTPTALAVSSISGSRGKTATLYATLWWGVFGEPSGRLPGKVLSFYVDGALVGTTTSGSNGAASVSYPVPGDATVGPHAIKVKFLGDAAYAACEQTATLTVQPSTTVLAVSSVSGTVSKTTTLYATLWAGSSKLAGKELAFFVDDVPAGTATTGPTGAVAVAYAVPVDLGGGAHTIRVEFAGSADYAASSKTATLTVSKLPTTLAVASVTGTHGKATTLYATLWSGSSRVAGKSLGFFVDGALVGTATTSATGAAKVAYAVPAGMSVGPHTIKVVFDGSSDPVYGSCEKTATLTVN